MHNKIYFNKFVIKKTVLIGFLMVIGVQNQLPINFNALQDINDFKFYPHTHEFLTFNINQSILIKSEPKVIKLITNCFLMNYNVVVLSLSIKFKRGGRGNGHWTV